MLLFSKRMDARIGRGSPSREPLFLAAAILTLDRSSCPDLIDVTTEGARLRRCRELAVGQDLWIKVGILDAIAKVDWVLGEVCGITFETALSDEDADHLRREGRNTLVTRLTPDEKLIALNWITGSRT